MPSFKTRQGWFPSTMAETLLGSGAPVYPSKVHEHEAIKILPSGNTKAEPMALPISPQKLVPGGITGEGLARTQLVSVLESNTTVCGWGKSVQFSVKAIKR